MGLQFFHANGGEECHLPKLPGTWHHHIIRIEVPLSFSGLHIVACGSERTLQSRSKHPHLISDLPPRLIPILPRFFQSIGLGPKCQQRPNRDSKTPELPPKSAFADVDGSQWPLIEVQARGGHDGANIFFDHSQFSFDPAIGLVGIP